MNWDWDVDLMSYMDIEKMIKNERYCNMRCLWYWNPKFSFSRGLQPLNDDKDVLRFMENVREFKLIDIYVEHKVEEVNIEDVRFDDANIEEVYVEDANAEDVNGEAVNVEEVNVEDANVEGANVEDENVEEINFEDANIEDVNSEDVNGGDANVNSEDVNNEDANVELNKDNQTDLNYNMSNEDGEESEDDEGNLGLDVGVDWTTVLPNTSIEQPSRLDDNSDNEVVIQTSFIHHLEVMLKMIWKGFQLLNKLQSLKLG
ncbi:unnamed protein product [Vicia faba]|uniref:PB1-like domain-containing protein n=1 Tax=Vicia faba TaxID=3906 RepID=A0AAV0YTD7_VICFA|nr:unnamed protein product [Vicia faba]